MNVFAVRWAYRDSVGCLLVHWLIGGLADCLIAELLIPMAIGRLTVG